MRLILLALVATLCGQTAAQDFSDDFSRFNEKRWARWAISCKTDGVDFKNGKLVMSVPKPARNASGEPIMNMCGITTKFPCIKLPQQGSLVIEVRGLRMSGTGPVFFVGLQKDCSVWPRISGGFWGNPVRNSQRLMFSVHLNGSMRMYIENAKGVTERLNIVKQGNIRDGFRVVITPGGKKTAVTVQTLQGKSVYSGSVDTERSYTARGDKNYLLLFASTEDHLWHTAFRAEVDYIRVGRGTASGTFVGAETVDATRPKFNSPEGTWLMIREGRADGGLLVINKGTAKEVKRGDKPPDTGGEITRRVCPLSWRSGRKMFTGTASVSGAVASFKMSSGGESFSGRLIFSSDYASAVGFWKDGKGEGVLRAVRYEGAPPAIPDDTGQPATFVGTWTYTTHHLVGVTKGLVNTVIVTVKPVSVGKVRIEWRRFGAKAPYGVGTATIRGRVLHYEWVSKENPGEKGHGWWVIGNRGHFISGVFEGDKGGGRTYGGVSHGERKK